MPVPVWLQLVGLDVIRRQRSPAATLRHDLLVHGLGGLMAPFLGIEGIDMILAVVGIC